jgi:cytochrome b involved in lipid metabolism
MKYTVISIIVFLLGLGALFALQATRNEPSTEVNPTPTTADSNTNKNDSISTNEVAKHNTASDCWMIIEGSVYDVTSYIARHPGGDEIVDGCGIDATELFANKGDDGRDHSANAKVMLRDYLIGQISAD